MNSRVKSKCMPKLSFLHVILVSRLGMAMDMVFGHPMTSPIVQFNSPQTVSLLYQDIMQLLITNVTSRQCLTVTHDLKTYPFNM